LTWLLAIARYKALSAGVGASTISPTTVLQLKCPIQQTTLEIALQKKDRSELLRAALSKLSNEHHEVLDLVYYHGRSVKETAELWGWRGDREDAHVLRPQEIGGAVGGGRVGTQARPARPPR
jgi:DNA-directed RNA polymerase specialized sigma24 family protein